MTSVQRVYTGDSLVLGEIIREMYFRLRPNQPFADFNFVLSYFLFQTLQRRMAELDESGPASPGTLGQQLITKKVAMVTVKQRLQEYQSLLGDLKERVKKIEQILEEELGRREKSKKDIGVIKIWITKTIQVIERKLDSSEPVDVTTLEVGLQTNFIYTG